MAAPAKTPFGSRPALFATRWAEVREIGRIETDRHRSGKTRFRVVIESKGVVYRVSRKQIAPDLDVPFRTRESAEEVLQILAQNAHFMHQTPVSEPEKPLLTGHLSEIFDSLRGDEAKYIDLVAKECGLSIAATSGYLLELEMRQLVKQLPGKSFLKR